MPFLVYCFYRFLFSLWRIQITEHPTVSALIKNNSPLILAHWHGDELALIHLVKRYRLATMTSQSKDGSIVDYVIHRLGGDTSRGSSSKGGVAALKGLIRLCRSGRIVSVAVDGPRGPIHQPKPGVFELSKLCSAPIVPVGVKASSSYLFTKSWNKAYLPYPFFFFFIYFGDPMPALTEADNAKSLKLQNELSLCLDGARRQAAKIIATV